MRLLTVNRPLVKNLALNVALFEVRRCGNLSLRVKQFDLHRSIKFAGVPPHTVKLTAK